MARIVYTGQPIQASTIKDYYDRLDAIRTWNGRYSAISNRGSVGFGVKITSAQIMNEIFESVVNTKKYCFICKWRFNLSSCWSYSR